MASEYFKWKFRDVKHRETPEYTPEQRRKNWWYYNKWLVIGGIAGAVILIDLFRTMTGMKEIHPDTRIAFLSDTRYSEEAIATLQDALAQYADDYNNDGRTYVEVRQFFLPENPTAKEQMYASYASEITLVSDMEECDSFLFIVPDPDAFQKAFEILSLPDGNLPQDFSEGMSCVFALKDLEAFHAETIDKDLRSYLDTLYIGRRGFWTDKTSENLEQSITFFRTVTGQKGH